ncbi:MFS transporter [Streptomyces sp. NPDC004134]|uniref:MFS transporter n=1 Tax=Streptomyces sp. NPDC004134 TaxID=3364691 RepID=UPI0036A53C23
MSSAQSSDGVAPPLSASPDPAPGPGAPGLSKAMVTLFAVAAGFAVANIYYCQPLLTAIADTFDVSSDTVSLIVIASTVGYAAGLGLLLPLGDIVNKKRLVVNLLLVVAAMQALSAAAFSVSMLIAASAVMSLTAVVAPILVPFAAGLAAPQERGRVTGSVMSGVLMGVLLARTGGGLIAELGGWRTVFGVAAALMVALALVLRRALPDAPPAAQMPYGKLLRSIFTIIREEPVLRLRCLYGFMSFAGFNALWTSIAFLLDDPPYSYGAGVIGLFGLAGVVGAYAARITGPQVDRGRDNAVTGVLFTVILASWGLMGLDGGTWLWALLLGVVVLDLGVQGMQVVNLAVNFRQRPEARSRITTAYMVAYFSGAIAGSSASAAAYAAGGWDAVVLTGAAFAAVNLLAWCGEMALRARRAPAGQA